MGKTQRRFCQNFSSTRLFSICLLAGWLWVNERGTILAFSPSQTVIQVWEQQRQGAQPFRRCKAVVTAKDTVYIRTAPRQSSKDLGLLVRGDQFCVDERDEHCTWLKGRTQSVQTEGWVSSQYLDLDKLRCDMLPITRDIPEPTPTLPAYTLPPPTSQPPKATPAPTVTVVNSNRLSNRTVLYFTASSLLLVGLLALGYQVFRAQRRKRPLTAHSIGSVTVQARPGIAYLEINPASLNQVYYWLDKPTITIGRDPSCEIRIDERYQTVSRRHAQIVRQGADYLVTDLNSASGIYLDNLRVGRNKLHDGVTLSLGQAVAFIFHRNQGGAAP